jgi:hypothetical protein
MIAATIATVFACDVVSFTVIHTVKDRIKHVDPRKLVNVAERHVIAAQNAARVYKQVIAKRSIR